MVILSGSTYGYIRRYNVPAFSEAGIESIRFRSISKRNFLQRAVDERLFWCYHVKHSRKSCRQQNIPKRTIKRNEGALRPNNGRSASFGALREKYGGGIAIPDNRITSNADSTAGWETCTARAKTRRQRASGERETHRGQPWQAASCRPICLDTQCPACTQDRLPRLGLKAVETPSTSCESCQALSALFPIAGARAANTAKKKTIATILATTQGRNSNFKLA